MKNCLGRRECNISWETRLGLGAARWISSFWNSWYLYQHNENKNCNTNLKCRGFHQAEICCSVSEYSEYFGGGCSWKKIIKENLSSRSLLWNVKLGGWRADPALFSLLQKVNKHTSSCVFFPWDMDLKSSHSWLFLPTKRWSPQLWEKAGILTIPLTHELC